MGLILLILSIFIIYYLHTNVFYIGNEANDMQLRSCGSLIWNSDHKVATLFCWCDSLLAIVYGTSVNALFKVGHALKIIPLK